MTRPPADLPASADTVDRARALIGARFRPQGRRADTGLDCVGLVAAATAADPVPRNYPLRGGSLEDAEAALVRAGLRRAEDLAAGRVIILQAGPGQLHFGIWAGAGLIHADAGLGRVVERPGPPAWPVLSIWQVEN